MRRKDRERDLAFAYEVLDSCEWMALSMTDGAGRPYCVPVQGVQNCASGGIGRLARFRF